MAGHKGFFQQLVRTLGFELDWSKITWQEMVNAVLRHGKQIIFTSQACLKKLSLNLRFS